MRWVHADCLSEWWKHRQHLGFYDLSTDGVQCDVCHEVLAQQVLGNVTWRTCLARAVCSWAFESCWCCWVPWRELREQFRFRFEERLQQIQRLRFLFALNFLMFWWCVAVTYRPHSIPPAHVAAFMQMGRWAFPVVLWYGVIKWAAAPTLQRWDREQHLHWSLRGLLLDHGDQISQWFVFMFFFLGGGGPKNG